MAKVEEVPTAVSGLERWQAERAASKLDKDIQQLKVAMAELDAVRPKKVTCVKRGGVFFVEKRDVIIKAKRNELKDKEKLRFDIGVHLRSIS